MKNIGMLVIIVVVTVFMLIGGTYAYYSVIFKDERTNDNENTNLNTGNLSENTIISNIPNTAGSFLSTDIYLGHKEVVGLDITTTGSIGSRTYLEFVYDIYENGLSNNVIVRLYESETPIEVTENYFECKKQTEPKDNDTIHYETRMDKNVGTLMQETNLNGETGKVSIGKDDKAIA